MELRQTFCTFVTYIKQHILPSMKSILDQLITLLQSQSTDLEIKNFVLGMLKSNTNPVSQHQRVSSQHLYMKGLQSIKQNAFTTYNAFAPTKSQKKNEEMKNCSPIPFNNKQQQSISPQKNVTIPKQVDIINKDLIDQQININQTVEKTIENKQYNLEQSNNQECEQNKNQQQLKEEENQITLIEKSNETEKIQNLEVQQIPSPKKIRTNLEIQIKFEPKVTQDFGKFISKQEIQNTLWLCIKQFQQNTSTLEQIYNHTSEVQTAYGIRNSQDIRSSGAQNNRKSQNPLFNGYNSKLMNDDQLIAIQNNFLMKKQIVKAKRHDSINEGSSEFHITQQKQQQKKIFLL